MTENITLLFIQLDQLADFITYFSILYPWVLIKVTFN